ncbi:MAG: hypothetical protein FWG25_08145, partial [Promicromonosporaceae bacterium]|nr:hypothetical protein [Promicromonosporaceae bacterium]
TSPAETGAPAVEEPTAPEVEFDESYTPPAPDPGQLLNIWRVAAPDESLDTFIIFEPSGYTLFRECGLLWGQWTANSAGQFLASVPSEWADACPEYGSEVPWLDAASEFELTPDGFVLLNPSGEVTAAFWFDATGPERDPDLPDWVYEPVEADMFDLAFLRDLASLPAGFTVPGTDELLGEWVLAGERDPDVLLNLLAFNQLELFDGCETLPGAWRVGRGGELLSFAGWKTFYCEGDPAAFWFTNARLVGFDDDGAGVRELVLFDYNAEELGRLVRAESLAVG